MNRTLRDVLDAFSSPQPTPGGGSASALACALGTALLQMVASLPKSRTNTDDEKARLAAVGEPLQALRERLSQLIERDSDAYNAVVAAYRLPKSTDGERNTRQQAIQDALVGATETPLDITRNAALAVKAAVEVAQFGSPSASSDVRVALELIAAGIRGAAFNVTINLDGQRDVEYASRIRADLKRLTEESDRAIRHAQSVL